MHNVVYLIGRLTEDPTLKNIGDEKDMLTINLAVQRSYKNENGLYETDFIRCILWNGIAKSTSDYCHKGDLVGVKGRLQTRKYKNEQEEEKYYVQIFDENITEEKIEIKSIGKTKLNKKIKIFM